MPRFRRGSRDRNHSAIQRALESLGVTCVDVSNCTDAFDIIAGYRGVTFAVEVKRADGKPSQRALRPSQAEKHDAWNGRPIEVVRTLDDCAEVVERVMRESSG